MLSDLLMENNRNLEELLTKYFTGEITAYEKKLLFQAMDTDMALREEFLCSAKCNSYNRLLERGRR